MEKIRDKPTWIPKVMKDCGKEILRKALCAWSGLAKFRINLVEKAGGGFERIISNFERSSTMGKTLSKSIAC